MNVTSCLLRFAACLLGGLASTAAMSQGVGPTTSFEVRPCTIPIESDEVARRLTCGVLTVPRLEGKPEAGVFRLAVVRRASKAPTPGALPVLFLHGGPGQGVTRRLGTGSPDFSPGHELIAFDMRGGGDSSLGLCKETNAQVLGALARDLGALETTEAARLALFACERQFRAAGLTTEMFGTRANTGDAERLRIALGIPRWNVYGVSYGTVVAADYAATHPDAIAAVVLDSMYPPDDMLLTPTATLDRTLKGLDAVCARDPSCAALHGDLPGELDRVASALDRHGLDVKVPGLGLPADTFSFSGTELRATVLGMSMFRDSMVAVPLLLRQVAKGDGAALRFAIKGQAGDGQDVVGGLATDCRDRGRHHVPWNPKASEGVDLLTGTFGVCPAWGPPGEAPRLGAAAMPVLVLMGQLDPLSTAAYGLATQRVLGPTSTLFVYPGVGHDVRNTPHTCGRRIVGSFLDDPTVPLETGCVAADPPLRVLTSAWRLPALADFAPSPSSVGKAFPVAGLVFLVGAALLLVSGLIVPLAQAAWRRNLRALGGAGQVSISIAALVVATASAAFAAVVAKTLSEQPALLMFGLPAGASMLAWLPWLAVAAGLLAVYQLVRGQRVPSVRDLVALIGLALCIGASADLGVMAPAVLI